MSLEDDLRKEEFVQNYLQYRWLDDTRSKLIDRFFIVVIAVFAARFQFYKFFEQSTGWTFGLYLFFIFFASFMAKSIVSFRRQQRGHNQYIKVIRSRILTDDTQANTQFADYKRYIGGKKIYLTRWIEFIVVMVAALSPLLLWIDPVIKKLASCTIQILTSFWFVLILVVVIILFVGLPFYKYNFKRQLNWDKD